jgi:hypothetical protein
MIESIIVKLVFVFSVVRPTGYSRHNVQTIRCPSWDCSLQITRQMRAKYERFAMLMQERGEPRSIYLQGNWSV